MYDSHVTCIVVIAAVLTPVEVANSHQVMTLLYLEHHQPSVPPEFDSIPNHIPIRESVQQ